MINIKDMLDNTQPSCGNTKVIAIDGHGGSGKSTWAEIFAKQFNAGVIHTDDFAGRDNPENWWPLVIERVFEPIKNGATTLSYPRSQWWDNQKPEPVTNQPVTNVIILEGVSSLRKEFRPYVAFGIYVDTPLNVCFQRGLERDGGKDGKSDDEIMRIWGSWQAKEEAYMQRDNPKEFADLTIDGTQSLT